MFKFFSKKKDTGAYLNMLIDAPVQEQYGNAPIKGTLKEWMHKKFGIAACNLFFDPFNVSYTSGLYSYVIQDDANKTPIKKEKAYNEHFYYPVQGLDHLILSMAMACNVIYRKEAKLILPHKKKIVFVDGEIVSYDRLISTIPLRELVIS